MAARRFGPVGRQLFGFHHPPAAAAKSRATSVLLCNPYAQSALRAQRMLRMLAQRLARSGFPVLRFDYYATGDSDGDCEAADLDRWSEDILLANAELENLSRTRRCAWIGLELGAALAARASLELEHPLAALILWEPVLDGAAYLAQLRRMHDQYFRYTPHVRRRKAAATLPGAAEQLLGFPLSVHLREQFQQLGASIPVTPQAEELVVFGKPQDGAKFGAARTQVLPIPSWGATDFDDLGASALVYNEVIQTVTARIEKLP